MDDAGLVTAVIWLNLDWKDPRLSWDKEDFGGIKSLTIDPSYIWTPDIEMYNRYANQMFWIGIQRLWFLKITEFKNLARIPDILGSRVPLPKLSLPRVELSHLYHLRYLKSFTLYLPKNKAT